MAIALAMWRGTDEGPVVVMVYSPNIAAIKGNASNVIVIVKSIRFSSISLLALK